MNLIEAFLDTAGRAGGRRAIVAGTGKTISYADLARRSGGLAASLRQQGVGRDTRVLVAMPVGIGLYLAIAALWRLGATIVFPEPAMGLLGVRRAVEIATPRAVLVSGVYRLLPWLEPRLWGIKRLHLDTTAGDPAMDLADDHPALISFTSGSTGKPKAIVRSHGFLAAQNRALRPLLAPRREDEADLIAFPVFVIANLSLGITSVLPNWRLSRHDLVDAAGIRHHMDTHRVTRALIPPAIAEALAGGTGKLDLDAIFTGGGPVFPDLLERLSRTAPRADIVTVYGSTEAEPIAHQRLAEITALQWQQMRQGNGLLVGKSVPEIALRIISDEIVVTGDHVNKSYLNGIGDSDNKLRLEGTIWHRTGDAGRLDTDGNLWLRGRLAASANGRYAFEIETVARTWPGVTRAAMVPGSKPTLIALEGTEPAPGAWAATADSAFGARITKLSLPMDRRHGSKVDYRLLERAVRRQA